MSPKQFPREQIPVEKCFCTTSQNQPTMWSSPESVRRVPAKMWKPAGVAQQACQWSSVPHTMQWQTKFHLSCATHMGRDQQHKELRLISEYIEHFGARWGFQHYAGRQQPQGVLAKEWQHQNRRGRHAREDSSLSERNFELEHVPWSEGGGG